MKTEDYLTPLVGQLIVGAVMIGTAYICGRIMNRWIDKKLTEMDRERLLNLQVPQP